MLIYAADHYFLDTEFYDPSNDIHPRNEPFVNMQGNRMTFALDFFSIGLVADDGKEYYGVIKDINEDAYRGHWVSTNVLAQLPPKAERRTLEQIGLGVLSVFRSPQNAQGCINIWARNGSYDNVVLDRIFSGQLTFHELLRERLGIERVKYRDTNELLNKFCGTTTPIAETRRRPTHCH